LCNAGLIKRDYSMCPRKQTYEWYSDSATIIRWLLQQKMSLKWKCIRRRMLMSSNMTNTFSQFTSHAWQWIDYNIGQELICISTTNVGNYNAWEMSIAFWIKLISSSNAIIWFCGVSRISFRQWRIKYPNTKRSHNRDGTMLVCKTVYLTKSIVCLVVNQILDWYHDESLVVDSSTNKK